MTFSADKIRSRLAIEMEDLPCLEANAGDRIKDKDGGASDLVARSRRAIGILRYLLDGDVSGFRENLSESARIADTLFVRFERGEAISPSFGSMTAYQALFDALAATDMALAEALAKQMGGREEIERAQDHPFDYAFGYALRSFVLAERTPMKRRSTEFSKVCQKPANANFRGYAELFDAMIAMDAEKANTAVHMLIRDHERESRGRGSSITRWIDTCACGGSAW